MVLGTADVPSLETLIEHRFIRLQALSPIPLEIETKKVGRRSKTFPGHMKIFFNLYAEFRNAETCGAFLTENNIRLQHPEYPDPDMPYRNPHVLSPEFEIVTKCEPQGGVASLYKSPTATLEDLETSGVLQQLFSGLDGGDELRGINADARIRTKLMEYAPSTSWVTASYLSFLMSLQTSEKGSSFFYPARRISIPALSHSREYSVGFCTVS